MKCLPALGKGGRLEGGKKEHSAWIPPLGRKVYVAEQRMFSAAFVPFGGDKDLQGQERRKKKKKKKSRKKQKKK